ncbi:Zinc finger FYVE domain-containing protein 9 [Amphibalanus amphitrite]|uniref:Zinc finger FYVE domain-containing protein 9 n=1 Tax=Amphibalanus amphitrite TaxID=1232801 RepID=A0A6A4WYY9_AMPAM|nr:Zinc finger FYVE domain-containing protein 9 [Amphibalanus amphitrite]
MEKFAVDLDAVLDEFELNEAPSVAAPTVAEPTAAAETTPEPAETDQEPAEADPEPAEAEQEPVRFRPADDVSDSELETYLEELEGDDTGGNAAATYEEARLAAGRPAAVPAPSGGATPPRGQLVSLSDEDKNLGKVAPVWVPDEDAVACMECSLRFTVIRRRHHCRACGRLLCSACCSERICLDYMEFREGRVCSRCKRTIDRVQQESRVVSAGGASPSHHQMARPPNPNNPMEYCSTVPPTQQASHNAPPPTVMVPSGVLKRSENSGGRTPSREAKQVMFSDGIRPGGDLTEPARPSGQRGAGADPELRRPPHRRTARLGRGPDRSPAAILKDAKGCKDLAWKPESGKLPPIYQAGSAGSAVKQSTPEETIVSMIRAERDLPWSFLINKNLMVVVKMFKLDCCVGRTCWIFTSHGLSTVGQEEVVVILESLPDEAALPKDIFFFYHHLFAEAAKGHFVTELGNTLFSAPFLGSKDHGGFLYLRPTFQCLHNVPAPPQPFLVAVLIQKWEAPWAKVFPLRLLLRLGAEFRYYPCPLVSVRHRKPVFYEVGHTIINLLADFRNFAYVLPTVHGMHIHMEEQETSVLIPRNRFNQVLKAINNSNDHVLALGASFSREADSHLVCMQNEDGQYQTQAINIQNRPRQVTGASFVVFNGALKSAAGVTAKSSIVEDGLMFQISPDTMETLRGNLRQMQDFKIECGPVGQPPDEVINIKWVEDDRSHNLGVRSVIDDKPLDGIPSIRVHSGTDYVGDSKLIRWTEVYLIKVTESVARSSSEPPDFSRLAEEVARGTCVALTPHLPLLADSERTRIGLRATVDRDTVCYEAGSNGEALPPSCMSLLDSELVPVLHRYAAEVPDSPTCLELLFHVIDR